jgi:glycosyltransferase involved in cell wall biosynthesis
VSLTILNTAPYYWPEVGGLENLARELTDRLDERDDVDVQPVASCSCEDVNDRHQLATGTIHLPTSAQLYHTPVGLGWTGNLRELIRDRQADAVLTHTPVPGMADASVRAAEAEDVASVVFHHNDLDPRTPLHRVAIGLYRCAVGKATLARADRIVVTSEAYAEESPELTPHRDKLGVVPPGVDTERFHPRNAEPAAGPPEIAFVGRLDDTSSHKGLPVLFEALSRLDGREVRLCVVGDGDRRAAYEKRAGELGVAESTRFLGFVDDDELARIYARARTVCLPSVTRSEGFGLVLLEAQASGTPVVGSDIGGIPQALEPEETGVLVEPGDADDLAAKLARLLDDPKRAETMGYRGRERVEDRFTWDKAADRMATILREVAG